MDVHKECEAVSIFDSTPQVEGNISSMEVRLACSTLMSPVTTVPSLESFSGVVATPEQEKDLLQFWEVGMERFKNRISYFILKEPSATVPQRQARLLTFASTKSIKSKVKLIEKEKRLVNRCIRRTLVWNAKHGTSSEPHSGQYLELPRAISDPHGNPHKGLKSYTTKWLENRYKSLPLVTNQLPDGCIPDDVIIEGMFLINISPLGIHATMKDYSTFLL